MSYSPTSAENCEWEGEEKKRGSSRLQDVELQVREFFIRSSDKINPPPEPRLHQFHRR
jgi:hypothetical protein